MDLTPTLINALVVATASLVLGWMTQTQFREVKEDIRDIRRRLDTFPTRDEMDTRFRQVDERFDRVDDRLDRLERSVDQTRSDLTQVALAVGARSRPQTG